MMKMNPMMIYVIQVLCVVEFLGALVEFIQTAVSLHHISYVFITAKSLQKLVAAASKNETTAEITANKISVDDVGTLAIKMFYFIMLFFIIEMVLAVYLFRGIQKKDPQMLKIWLVMGTIYTVLYVTDFISSVHVMAVFDDLSLGFGILTKIPLLVLVYMYYKSIPNHPGAAVLVNEL